MSIKELDFLINSMYISIRNLLDDIINKLQFSLPVISLKGIEYKNVESILRMIANYQILLKLGNLNVIRNRFNTLKKSPNVLLRELSSLRSDISGLRFVIDYLAISKTLLNSNKENKLIQELSLFTYEVVQLLSSLYNYMMFKERKLVLLFTIYDVHTFIPLEGAGNIPDVVFLIYPYHLRGTPDFYILALHEFGHILQKYHIIPTRSWTKLENCVISKLKSLNKNINYDKISMFRKWIRELFADYFALSVSGIKYINSFWSQYGHLLEDEGYAKETKHIYPPLTIRFKLLIEGLHDIDPTKKLGFSSYINEIIKKNSNKVLAGYFEVNELNEFILFLKQSFNNIIKENAYGKIPLNVINDEKYKFKTLFKLISMNS